MKKACFLLCIPSYQVLIDVTNQIGRDDSLVFLTGDHRVHSGLQSKGITDIFLIDGQETFIELGEELEKIIFIEDSLADTCFLLKIVRASSKAPIIVMTKNKQYPLKFPITWCKTSYLYE
ncbi:hypothetical protein AF332_26700 [Sporosarcina globispora]|uniref:Uncharacterized protein n=1 Tax=Sporosarcina globispora TaxID=1459 RepID=A0A0M0GJW3_SPOGL|nr:hypothetical protein [Sporosarcina globispora]KON90043.1 hypothetical protein AF332_26700 [Sporosarcina globispora]